MLVETCESARITVGLVTVTVESVSYRENGRRTLLIRCDCKELHRITWCGEKVVQMLCGATVVIPKWVFDPVGDHNARVGRNFVSGSFAGHNELSVCDSESEREV